MVHFPVGESARRWRKAFTSVAGVIRPPVELPEIPPPLTGGEFVLASTDVGDFWLPCDDEVIRPYLQHRATWEAATGDLLKRLLRPGTNFLDVGAGVGYFSAFAAKAACGVTVDAVEPHPRTCALLRFNLWVNQVPARVWPVALDVAAGALPLSVSTTNLGDTRGIAVTKGGRYDLVAATVAADDLFAGRSFDVVKIDVQGREFEVLLGMQRIVGQSPDIAVIAEYWPDALRRRDIDPMEVLEGYRRLGFEVVVVREKALEALDFPAIIAMCDSAGPGGQVNLLLSRH